jgi:beta-glucosidase
MDLFPTGFFWGAATASYQIEGAAAEDGKGASVWDMMCRKKGAIHNNQTGEIACDHYHRYAEDIAIMKQIGLKAYRLSVSWPRVLPDGTGSVNSAGLAFYDRLIDGLLEAGITPFVTLFHWDFPLALYHRGGWLNRDSADWFADYAAVVVARLSDRVRHWMTLNEPQCFIGLGLVDGIHAPGDKLAWAEVLQAGHHALLAHGKAVQTLRALAKTPPVVGFAPATPVYVPVSDQPSDVDAARSAMFGMDTPTYWTNAWFSDPIFRKQYPEDAWKVFGRDVPRIADGDFDVIAQPLDFYGCNIYNGALRQAGADGKAQPVAEPPGHARTAYDWYVTPEALYWGPRFLYERYGLPIIVTENGMSNVDWVSLDGQVHDPQRIDYTARYLLAFSKAYQDGVDVRGYFHWSLMDNFEWAQGFKERFGLVHVDFVTQQRTPKDSAHWYAEVIRTNGASLSKGQTPHA